MANATGPSIRPIPPDQIQQWRRDSSHQIHGAHERVSREIRAELQKRGIEVFADAHYGMGSLGDLVGEERNWDGNVSTHRTLDLATMEWSKEIQLVTDRATIYPTRGAPRLQELGFDIDRGEPGPAPTVSAATLCE